MKINWKINQVSITWLIWKLYHLHKGGIFTKQEVLDGAQSENQLMEEEEAKKNMNELLDLSEVIETDFLDRADKEPPTSLMSVTHITGFLVNKVLRRQGGKVCDECAKTFSTDIAVTNPFHEHLNRGGDAFFNPSMEANFAVRIVIGLFLEIMKTPEFKHKFMSSTRNQHETLLNLSWQVISSSNINLERTCEECGSNSQTLYRKFVTSCVHVLLSNEVNLENDQYHTAEGIKRAKKYYENLEKNLRKKKPVTLLSQQQEDLEFDSQQHDGSEPMEIDHADIRLTNNEAVKRSRIFRSSSNQMRKLQIFGNRQAY